MKFADNKFTVTEVEEQYITSTVSKIMNTFPSNIAEYIVEDIEIELTGLYTLTICNEYLKTLSPGVSGEVLIGGYAYALIKIEEDLLISPL